MAQDFHAAFGLGVSDKLIDTIDPDGVALAAIQGLHALVEENEMRLAEKDAEIAELREQVKAQALWKRTVPVPGQSISARSRTAANGNWPDCI